MPLLSIVIPTKNRADTAYHCIRNCLSLASGNIEIIVHDCSDNNDLETKIKQEFSDERLSYYHVDPVSMTKNWNLAMEKAGGEYVLFLGDDDGITAELVNAAEWAQRNGIDAVSTPRGAEYFWPNFPDKRRAGKLLVRSFTGKVTFPGPQAEFERSLSHPRPPNYTLMPTIYTGFVRRALMKEILHDTGTYFDSINVDYYLSLMLLPRIKKYAVIDYPLAIVGLSGKSNSARSQDTKGRADFLLEYTGFVWPEELPQNTRSSIGYYMEPKLTAFKNMKRNDLIKKIDYPYCYAVALIEERGPGIGKILQQYERTMKKLGINEARGWILLIAVGCRIIVERIVLKIWSYSPMKKNPFFFSAAAANIEQAETALTNQLRTSKQTFHELLQAFDVNVKMRIQNRKPA
jgi:glycosyltransferase involved in cell wall biosynthesis